MTSIGDRLNDREYRNWIRATLCLQYTREGLLTYADEKSQELYRNVIRQLGLQGIPTINNPCGSFSFNKRTKTPCCNSCSKVLAEIEIYKSGILNLNLKNSDLSCLLQHHWQMAKLFMNVGQDIANCDPNNADISGVLNFLDHCLIPRQGITHPDNIRKVRDIRNEVIHSADQRVTDNDFQNRFVPLLIDLLQDPATLSHNREAQLSVKRIKEIKGDDFVITKETERKALEGLAKEMMEYAKQLKESSQSIKEAHAEIQKVQILLERLKTFEEQQKQTLERVEKLETKSEEPKTPTEADDLKQFP